MIHEFKRKESTFAAMEWNGHRAEESLEILINWTGFIQCYIERINPAQKGMLVCPGLPGKNTAYDGDIIVKDEPHKIRIYAREDFLKTHEQIKDKM